METSTEQLTNSSANEDESMIFENSSEFHSLDDSNLPAMDCTNSAENMYEMVKRSYKCAVCNNYLDIEHVFLPCKVKVCKKHLPLISMTQQQNQTFECPNQSCRLGTHALPRNLDEWSFETFDSMQILDLLKHKQELDDLIDDFNKKCKELKCYLEKPELVVKDHFEAFSKSIMDSSRKVHTSIDSYFQDMEKRIDNLKDQSINSVRMALDASILDSFHKTENVFNKLEQQHRGNELMLNKSYLNGCKKFIEKLTANLNEQMTSLKTRNMSASLKNLALDDSFRNLEALLKDSFEMLIEAVESNKRPTAAISSPLIPLSSTMALKAIQQSPLIKLVDKYDVHTQKINSSCFYDDFILTVSIIAVFYSFFVRNFN